MKNTNLLARSLAAVWHPCTQMKRHESFPLIPIARAQGAWLYDADGKRYLDAVSSWWVNLFGHGEPRIKAAICQQMDSLEHVMLAGFTHQPVVELSERLAKLTGLGHAFYGSDGASAIEVSLKMSVHYWRNLGQAGKNRFIYLENSYHGETVGALSVTDVPIFRSAYAPMVRENFCVMNPDARQAMAGETAADVAERAIQALAATLDQHYQEIAALIIEPLVQGAAGMAMYDLSYLQKARALCDRYQVHLICDEIAVGFGRTGSMFAYKQANIKPDFLCLSKGITGGFLPLAVVLSRDEIYAAFYHDDIHRAFLHSHSYTGNPLACAAALAVLDIFENDDVIAVNAEKAQRWEAIFAPLAAHPRVQNYRRSGMIWAFDVLDAAPGFAQLFFAAALEQSILLRPIGNTVYFMPPYCLTDAEAAHLLSGTLAALDVVENVIPEFIDAVVA
ncbi:adenosylmethionine--8-amino-7-oxononanoate transaminase [Iodobacter fluviatilis]|uniref:Adenosylmethionine-8-amino-7-oxononanoate aminotransferase n=1 Tax=Iodobacter fluviatilis TaxID=537 RepID=A0A377SUI5_9NEIS|nr:adenosylmethionine--8-amino-7-oxononanoate transaminase [Iodobacter fluviatilis]TCU88200.1 adenosylmethionine-8-amino-7-oxononanoate aminotransferase [Iodobacter fluviatilis]STR45701.1 Adenosylmethionine-8-amino-7-oxononanoate aminotransferase [Iodobacter fluviatilis]